MTLLRELVVLYLHIKISPRDNVKIKELMLPWPGNFPCCCHWDFQLFALIEMSLVLLRTKRALGKFNSTWFSWETVPVMAEKDTMLTSLMDAYSSALKDNRSITQVPQPRSAPHMVKDLIWKDFGDAVLLLSHLTAADCQSVRQKFIPVSV